MKQYDYFNTLLPELVSQKEGAIAPSITTSAAFGYTSAQEAEDIFANRSSKPMYARAGNPTGGKLERALARMEGGEGSVVASSGMGAISMVMTAFLQSGDRVLCVGGFFGGTFAMMRETVPRFGIEPVFCDVDDLDKIESELKKGVKILFLESVGNPNLRLPDLKKIADICNIYKTLMVVDNTLTPLIVQPLLIGADLVIYSTTKIISGHSAALGGAVVYRALKEDDDKLKDVKFSSLQKFFEKGKPAIGMILRKRAIRDFGMSANAFASFLTMLGLETLALRTKRVNESVEKVVLALKSEGVNVRHPSLKEHEHNSRYCSLFDDGCGPLFTIDCGNKEKAFEFLDTMKMIVQTANVGDNRTLALHMASTIYSDFDENSQKEMGVTPGLIRLSMGIQAPDVISEDIIEAWRKSN